MNTALLMALLAVLSLASCSSTSSARATTRHGGVEFHTDTAIVAFTVRDLAVSKAWYARVLGASVVYEVPEQRWCEVTTPALGTLLGLHEKDGAGPRTPTVIDLLVPANRPGAAPGTATALGMSVVDMAAARAHLVANGVQLENDVFEIPGIVKLLYFFDPDGNRMWFYAAAG